MDSTDNKSKDYVPCKTAKDTFDLTEHFAFSKKHFSFLEEYAKDLDANRSAKEIGIHPDTAKKWLRTDAFKQELMAIHEVWRTNIRMTSAHASAKLIELMDKFESDYDEMDHQDKSKMAGALVKGADSYLKATGKYNQEKEIDSNQIVINIDLSGELKPREVDGEILENE